MTRRPLLVAAFVVALAAPALAQDRISGANYPLAQKFNKAFIDQHVQEVNVSPQWIGKTDVFWYAARTATGNRYWKVDPAKKEKVPLFDHVTFAAALSEASHKPLDAETLTLSRAVVSEDGKKLTFVFAEYRYEYDLAAGKLKQLGKAPAGPAGGPMTPDQIERLRRQLGDEQVDQMLQRLRDGQQDDTQRGGQPPAGGPGGGAGSYKAYSPDKKQYLYVYKYNLYLCEEGQPEDKATQLTKDGAEDYTFGGGFGPGGFGNRTGTGLEPARRTPRRPTARPGRTPPGRRTRSPSTSPAPTAAG